MFIQQLKTGEYTRFL